MKVKLSTVLGALAIANLAATIAFGFGCHKRSEMSKQFNNEAVSALKAGEISSEEYHDRIMNKDVSGGLVLLYGLGTVAAGVLTVGSTVMSAMCDKEETL